MDTDAESRMAYRFSRDIKSLGIIPMARIAIRTSDKHKCLLSYLDLSACDSHLPRCRPEILKKGSLVAEYFFEGVAHQTGSLAKALPLLGTTREAKHRQGDRAHRRIHSRRKERSAQHAGLALAQLAGSDRVKDLRAEASVGKILPAAVVHNPGTDMIAAIDRGMKKIVSGAKSVKDHASVGQEILSSLFRQAHRVRKNF